MVWKIQIMPYGRDEAFIPLPDELCKEWDIQEGDDIDVSYNKEEGAIVIKLLK